MSSLFSVRTFNKISRVGLTRFPPDMYQVASELSNPDSILLRSHKLKAEDVDNSVKAIARCGAGVNNIPVDAMSERGVVVFNTPGSNANAVQELALAGILLSARDIYQSINWSHAMDQSVEQDQMNKTVEEGKKIFGGAEIRGKSK
jgi:D-3-phosphoglycerate dehydrogenase